MLLVEPIAAHDVRNAAPSSLPSLLFPLLPKDDLSFCVLQYTRFIQLMERLLSLPYCASEEEFVLRYRKQLEAQSRKQMVPQLEKDERGVAFSTAEGRHTLTHTFTLLFFIYKFVSVSLNSSERSYI